MKEYTSNQRKKIVLKINKVKNKEILALKYKISIRTYYYWKRNILLLEKAIRNLFYYKT